MVRRDENERDIEYTLDASEQVLPEGMTPEEFVGKPPLDLETKRRVPISKAASVKTLSKVWSSTHKLGAKVFDEPGLALTPAESKELGELSVDFMKAWGWDMVANQKVAASINLTVAVIEIDAPRVFLVVTKRPDKRETQEPEGAPPVIIMPE